MEELSFSGEDIQAIFEKRCDDFTPEDDDLQTILGGQVTLKLKRFLLKKGDLSDLKEKVLKLVSEKDGEKSNLVLKQIELDLEAIERAKADYTKACNARLDEFKEDLADENGIDHLHEAVRAKVYSYAWTEAHSSGLGAVSDVYSEVAEIALLTANTLMRD